MVNVRTHGESGFNWYVRESPCHAISVPSGLELGRNSLLSSYFGIPGPRQGFCTSLSLWQWWSFSCRWAPDLAVVLMCSRASTVIKPHGPPSSFETFLASCFCRVDTLMWRMQHWQEALATARSELVSLLVWILPAQLSGNRVCAELMEGRVETWNILKRVPDGQNSQCLCVTKERT